MKPSAIFIAIQTALHKLWEITPIDDPHVPMTSFAEKSTWSVFNFVLISFGIFIALILVLWFFVRPILKAHTKHAEKSHGTQREANRSHETEKQGEQRDSGIWCIASVSAATIALAVFFITEDIATAPTLINAWTPFVVLVFILQCFMMYAAIAKETSSRLAQDTENMCEIRRRINVRFE